MSEDQTNPKLRLIDAQPISYEGETYLLLRDQLALTDKNLLVPQPMVPILSLMDGTRSASAIRGSLALRYGLFITQQRVDEFIKTMDDALLLENDRSRRARAIAQAKFRKAAFRPPANAGLSYPEEPDALSAYLESYFDMLDPSPTQAVADVRGIISPHIDYERGGPVYAKVWRQAARSVREADLAIIFGTDHYSEGHQLTLTRQNYATPFGTLPNPTAVVDELASVIGESEAFAGELHHRHEHSIELAAVWMHHVRGGQPIETIPVLCGTLGTNGELNGSQKKIDKFLDVLRKAMQGRKAIVVAAGDLAHVGPAFGGDPVDPGTLITLKEADDGLIAAMCKCDADGFYQSIQAVEDRNNVCGVSPIYLTLRLLEKASGQNHGYSVCPADQQNTSVVTICGITLR